MKYLLVFLSFFLVFNVCNSSITKSIHAVKDQPLEIKCNTNSTLLYCWIGGPDGKSYSGIPDSHFDHYEYIGDGLANGDCGIRIKSINSNDRGRWSCNFGTGKDITDIQQYFNIYVHDTPLIANKKIISIFDDVLWCQTLEQTEIEYCRFIRPDGLGIRPNNLSEVYSDELTDLKNGVCQMKLKRPTTADIGRWTCAAKLMNSTTEYYDTIIVDTYYNIVIYSTGLIALAWILFIVSMCMLCGLLMKTRMRKRTRVTRNDNRVIQSPPPYSVSTQEDLPEKIPLP